MPLLGRLFGIRKTNKLVIITTNAVTPKNSIWIELAIIMSLTYNKFGIDNSNTYQAWRVLLVLQKMTRNLSNELFSTD